MNAAAPLTEQASFNYDFRMLGISIASASKTGVSVQWPFTILGGY